MVKTRELISNKERLKIEISYLNSAISLMLNKEGQDTCEIKRFKLNIENIISTTLLAVRHFDNSFTAARETNSTNSSTLSTLSCIDYIARWTPIKDEYLVKSSSRKRYNKLFKKIRFYLQEFIYSEKLMRLM